MNTLSNYLSDYDPSERFTAQEAAALILGIHPIQTATDSQESKRIQPLLNRMRIAYEDAVERLCFAMHLTEFAIEYQPEELRSVAFKWVTPESFEQFGSGRGAKFLEQRFERNEIARWVKVVGLKPIYLFTLDDVATTSSTIVSALTAATPAPVTGKAWINKARERAAEIIKRQREKDLYPNQEHIGDEIAREFRAAGTVGADGKPLSGATIKRHALKGVSSAQGKQLSTRTGRGK